MDEYRSSIPPDAIERVVERYPGGEPYKVECFIEDALVGVIFLFQSGEPEYEIPLKDRVKHGTEYRWIAPGILLSAETYINGKSHGTAMQWSGDGKFVGMYTMEYGTGIDFWWGGREDGSTYLAEVRYAKDGLRHGPEWWLNADQISVFAEAYYFEGLPHGIFRWWNWSNRLSRGYPQYYIHGKRVKKAAYLRASVKDPTLIPFKEEDNQPYRQFPPEVQERLSLSPGSRR